MTEVVGFGERLETVATVILPDDVGAAPLVCFAWPGGGYSRRYFTFDMPDASGGGQAGWHAERGWIFVACDHLFAGDSSIPSDPTKLTFESLGAANRATAEHVLGRLANGTLADDLGPVQPDLTIGIGQSMGGGLLIVQQAAQPIFDAIGVLGYSGIQTTVWMPPEAPSFAVEYVPRGGEVALIDAATAVEQTPAMAPGDDGLPRTAPGFHYDDVPREIVIADMVDFPVRRGELPAWASRTVPPCVVSMLSPGVVADEAAAITAPIFIGVGERDVCPDPLAEPRAYAGTSDATVFVCPRMSHMHNFAGTRQLMWARLHGWAEAIRELGGM